MVLPCWTVRGHSADVDRELRGAGCATPGSLNTLNHLPGNSQGAGAGPQPDATPGCGTPTQLPNDATGFAGAVGASPG